MWRESFGTLAERANFGEIKMKTLASLAVIASAIVLNVSTASAGHDSPLYRAASNYREAVRDFEDHVFRIHYIDRYDKRLVDELEDATSHLRSAARHPDDLRRLLYRYRAVESLHFRVESALFGPDRYRANPVLARCWERVTCAHADLAEEIRCVCGHRGRPSFRHGHIGHGHRDFDSPRWPIDRDRRGGRDAAAAILGSILNRALN